MNEQEAIDKLKKLQGGIEPEYEHSHADRVLCEFIETLGYPSVVKEWKKVRKWYA